MPSKRHLRNNLMSLISITNPLANPNICVIQLFFSSLIVLTINYHLLTDHHCQWGANSHLYSWVCLLWKVQLIILAYQNLENIASSNQQVGFIWIYNYVPGTCIPSISCLLSAQQHKGGQTASTLWLQYWSWWGTAPTVPLKGNLTVTRDTTFSSIASRVESVMSYCSIVLAKS